jgi:hypothetical protein
VGISAVLLLEQPAMQKHPNKPTSTGQLLRTLMLETFRIRPLDVAGQFQDASGLMPIND